MPIHINSTGFNLNKTLNFQRFASSCGLSPVSVLGLESLLVLALSQISLIAPALRS